MGYVNLFKKGVFSEMSILLMNCLIFFFLNIVDEEVVVLFFLGLMVWMMLKKLKFF